MHNYKDNQLIMDVNTCFSLAAMSVLGDRDKQEDSFGFALKKDEGLAVVCDGMGGYNGGATVSAVAVDAFLKDYTESPFWIEPSAKMIELSKSADTLVCNYCSEKSDKHDFHAGTTLVSIYIKKKDLYWCSVGDSRAYLFRNGELVQLTQDQNYKAVLQGKRNAGVITEEEYQTEISKGEALISYLGIGNLNLIDFNEVKLDLQSNDRIIIMSDGLYKLLSDDEISRIIENFTNVGDALQALELKARKNAKNEQISRDNMTVIVIKIN